MRLISDHWYLYFSDEEAILVCFFNGNDRRLHVFLQSVLKMEERWCNSRSIKWDESQILGRGCEGTVVFSGHFNGKPVAVKRILLTNTQQVKRELEALLHCSHPRILQLFYVEKEDPFL